MSDKLAFEAKMIRREIYVAMGLLSTCAAGALWLVASLDVGGMSEAGAFLFSAGFAFVSLGFYANSDALMGKESWMLRFFRRVPYWEPPQEYEEPHLADGGVEEVGD